jgi:molybdopterin-binding protein
MAAFMTSTHPIALEARGLRKSYGGRQVVAVDELRVPTGEVFAVLGPNGSGKSTLFRMLALIEPPDAGETTYFGVRVSHRELGPRRRVAAVFQRPLLFPGKVRSNVAYGLRLHHIGRKEAAPKVEHALDLVGARGLADADVRTLSGGELQRIALARALVLEPSILFLDEPTSNLDVAVRRRFREDLREIVRRVTSTVVLITHDQSEALTLADSLVILRDGRIVQTGSPEEVFARPRDSFVADFVGMETVWRARVISCNDGLCAVMTKAGVVAEVVVDSALGEEITIAIRPEDVSLAIDGCQGARDRTSVRNHWPCVVVSLSPAGPLVHVSLHLDSDADVRESHLVALVTRSSAEELDLVPGLRVVAGAKATAIHVLEG